MESVTTSRAVLTCALCLAGLAAACSDDDGGADKSGDDRGSSGSTGESTDPLYAMMVQVYDEEDRTVYVSLSDTIDIESTEIEKAREFPGVANFAALDGRLLVSSGLEPTITEFDITAKHKWVEGRSVNAADVRCQGRCRGRVARHVRSARVDGWACRQQLPLHR